MRQKKQAGFTLIELMIATAIVGILAAIAYPSYTSYVRKSMRTAAKAQMLDIANRQQQYLLANRTYATSLANLNYNLPTELTTKYSASVAAAAAGSTPAFTITFTATGSQLSDGDLTLDNSGTKAPADKW